eukprot:scaffold8620_cov62-Phaeocystis_antarctica.AAC.10
MAHLQEKQPDTRCSECGQPLAPGSSFCSKCGCAVQWAHWGANSTGHTAYSTGRGHTAPAAPRPPDRAPPPTLTFPCAHRLSSLCADL